MKKVLGAGIIGLVVLFALIQLVPYGRQHTNPPVVSEPNWSNPAARQVAVKACYDCHSNETVWPWYSNIAPFSWLIQKDVIEGREKMNFSEWTGAIEKKGRGEREDALEEIRDVLEENEMPPIQYTIQHPTAKLSQAEKQALVDGLRTATSQK